MSETKAYALLFAGGLLAEIGSVIGIAALGGNGEAQAAVALICLVVMSFLVGVVGLRYDRPHDSSDH